MSQYDLADFNAASQAVKDGLSMRAAAQQFNVPCQTFLDRVRGVHGAKHSRPTVLLEEESGHVAEEGQEMPEWRYPFIMFDLQFFVKAYLDKGVHGVPLQEQHANTQVGKPLVQNWYWHRYHTVLGQVPYRYHYHTLME